MFLSLTTRPFSRWRNKFCNSRDSAQVAVENANLFKLLRSVASWCLVGIWFCALGGAMRERDERIQRSHNEM